MFVQVITGTTKDPDAFSAQGAKWDSELRPGATGYLGRTGGITADGRFVEVARFESEAAAQANSERPEQGAWWAEMEVLVDGAEFRNSTDVLTMFGGGKDGAGFVQVMRGRVKDTTKLAELRERTAELERIMQDARPDVIGEVIATHDDGTYTDVVYFSSEAEARANESKPMPPEAEALMGELMQAITIDEYYDLTAPDISS
jgi:hypothetical protein